MMECVFMTVIAMFVILFFAYWFKSKGKFEIEQNLNKAITMMRGKSPRFKCQKKKNFVEAILDFGGHFSINFVKFGTHNIKFTSEQVLFFAKYSMSIFLELFLKDSFLTICIHISKGRNSLNNC